jgi:hypothetical protein
MTRRRLVRVPRSPAAQLRAAIRRDGVRAAARAWGLTPGQALRVAADVGAPRPVVLRCLRRILAEVERA